VSFQRSEIVPALGEIASACARAGAPLLLDVYHHLNVAPFSISADGLGGAFVTGGGYKYCQLGEGACFLRFPRDCELRPVVTGWFAEFGALASAHGGGDVVYGPGPARFGGATYEPTSHYRAAAVFDFFAREGLTVPLLREVSQHQVGRLAAGFEALDLDPAVFALGRDVPVAGRAGFLALRCARADDVVEALRARGVATDARGVMLRLGPAPYLADRQIDAAVMALGEAIRGLG
jgi:kynureninase